MTVSKAVPTNLPHTVSLLFAYILLSHLEDAMIIGKPAIDLGRLNQLISSRNGGLYAHGFKPTDQKSHKNFRSFTDDCLLKLCQTEGWDMVDLRAKYRFVELPVGSVSK